MIYVTVQSGLREIKKSTKCRVYGVRFERYGL
jgi:hypothetical protein